MYHTRASLIALVVAFLLVMAVDAFWVVPPSSSSQRVARLFMGKGLNKANKQAMLKQKMEAAKRQKQGDDDGADVAEDDKDTKQLTAKEIKERNDRQRFEELLRKGGANFLSDYSQDGYLNKQQEEEEIDAFRKYIL